jgi:capsular polysaccharide biosynthesis protein
MFALEIAAGFPLNKRGHMPDDRATACRTVAEAKTVALAIASELGRNKPPKEIEDLAICVTDEAGTEVFRTRVVNQQPTKAKGLANTEGHPQGFSD